MKHIALLAEDISIPLDEGFKKATVSLAQGLTSIGASVSCFTNHEFDNWQGLPSNRLLLGSSFARNLKSLDPDLILYIPRSAATPMSLLRSHLLKKLTGKPVVLISLQHRSYPNLLRIPLRILLPDLVLVLSQRSASCLRDLGASVGQIPLGVDLERFKPPDEKTKANLRKKYDLGEGKLLLHVGHLTRRRNLEILMGLSSLNMRIVLVTSTSTSREVSIMSKPDECDVKVIDTYIEAIEEIYQAADAYVFPTFDEKGAIEIPLSVLEAMATNLPVLTTPFGGLPELFREGEGICFCHDLEEFRLAVVNLEEAECKTRDAVSPYSWERVASEIIDHIERHLG